MNSKTFGKTIRLFLIDGSPQGRMSCELSNWVGKAYKIPRTMIKDSADREELNNTAEPGEPGDVSGFYEINRNGP